MMIAHAEGRHPALAARDYDVIQGKPAKKSEAMMRDFIEAGGKVEWHALTDEIADATFTHAQTGSVRRSTGTWIAHAPLASPAKTTGRSSRALLLRKPGGVRGRPQLVWPLATSGMYVPEEQADYGTARTSYTGPTLEAEVEAPSDARQAINDAVPMRVLPPPPRRAPRVGPTQSSMTTCARPIERDPMGGSWLG